MINKQLSNYIIYIYTDIPHARLKIVQHFPTEDIAGRAACQGAACGACGAAGAVVGWLYLPVGRYK